MAVVNDLEDASEQIDAAISTAIRESKPVYISISWNLSGIPCPSLLKEPIPLFLTPKLSNQMALEIAVEATAEFLDKAVKPVLVGGPKLSVAKASKAFTELANCRGYPIAVLPSGKGVVPEHHKRFIGTYWEAVSTPLCTEIVESADANLFAGPVFDDYTSVGYSLLLNKEKAGMLSSNTAVISDAGDSWFNCQKLKLPEGCHYEFQMLYASIGWSVGATLGCAQAAPDKRVIACIGDGSFQMAAQEVSTMLRCGQRSIIFLIKNGGYTLEVEIHDGPYNVIKNWNYTALIDAIHNGEGKCWTTKVSCGEELVAAIETATGEKMDCLCFIEVIVHKDDTSKELLEFGSRLAAPNSRPPNYD
ncbi:hypothetical protein FEM48_Zijuj09G0195800 [Ziziphus jujuba var. spinosa]|uniref:pyruvate decarboxylase n=1 Tax=Ziziphus jujuba var. spinosa TaxID=714518 RepID=A0A978UUX2_ZIZJJ|nr:hypothetical protein FEM48_Zijuj09G0195800 [Ziziphus jujuba var. spinosa]